MKKRAIPYYQVFTERQGRSCLGLEAQQEAIIRIAQANGYDL